MSNQGLLAVKTHALGDLLLITPALHHLRGAFPETRISLLTTAACQPLLEGNPDVDRIVVLPGLGLYSALRALPALRRAKPHHAVVFQGSRAARALARMAGAHTVRSLQVSDVPDWPPPFDRYTADAYLDLARGMAPNGPSVSQYPRLFVSADERVRARALMGPGRSAVVAAGGGRNQRESVDAKRWSRLRFAQVCDVLGAPGGYRVVLVGAVADRDTVGWIAGTTRVPAVNLAGMTDLRTLAAVVGEAALVLTNDSVVLHMAVALNRPVVGLFGPTSRANFLPPGREHQRGVSSRAPCSPCYGNSMFPGCRMGRPVCMDAITAEEVVDAVRSVGS